MTRAKKLAKGLLLLLVLVAIGGAAWTWYSGRGGSGGSSGPGAAGATGTDPANDVTLGEPSTVDVIEAKVSDTLDAAKAKLDDYIRGL